MALDKAEPQVEFRPTTLRTWLVLGLLVAQVIASLVMVVALSNWYFELARLPESDRLVAEGASRPAALHAPLFVVQEAVYWVAWVPFLFWVYGVDRNLRPLGNRALDYSPGWAVGWYFVPLAALYKPFKALEEVWHGSDPATLGEPREAWAQRSIALLRWWWGFHLTAYFLQYLVKYIGDRATTVEAAQQFAAVAILAYVLVQIPHAILKLAVVWRIHQMQLARHAAIAEL